MMAVIRQLELIHELIRALAGALSSAALYSPEHQRVVEQLSRFADLGRQYFSLERELMLVVVEGEVLYQGKPLQHSTNLRRLLETCVRQGVGYLRFRSGFTLVELRQLLKVLLGREDVESLHRLTGDIQLGSVDAHEAEAVPAIARFEDLTTEQKAGLQQQFGRIADQEALDVKQIADLVAGFISAFRQSANPLLALVPIRMQDEYTFTHSLDVGILNIAQGMALGIDGQLLHDIGIAGMLHDVGKIFVDREILNKAGKLDDAEFAKIKEHPSRGAQYLMNQEGIPRLAVFSAYEHHMRYDLTGYPLAAAGWQLNICSQITMISDTFDALRTRRSYKKPWDFSKVSGLMLRLSGSQLNPDLTLNFLRTLAHIGEDLESFDDSPEHQDTMEMLLAGCDCGLANPRCG
ncbi:MAG: HD domain-containing protein [Desulfuromonadales bacterium]|nr:HD domain-containing protein [Desulfuromonadales bacterium]